MELGLYDAVPEPAASFVKYVSVAVPVCTMGDAVVPTSLASNQYVLVKPEPAPPDAANISSSSLFLMLMIYSL